MSMQRLLWNAVLAPAPTAGSAPRAGSTSRAAAEAMARSAAEALPVAESPLRLSVRPGSAARAEALLKRHGARYRVRYSPTKVSFLVDTPGGLTGHGHPFARQPRGASLEILAFKVP